MLGAIGQFETEIRAERQMDGILKAKNRGVRFGKKKSLTKEQLEDLKQKRIQGIKIKNLMQQFRLSKATIYPYLAQEGI
jgi:DNA invertase Pin-like site-specific DNA recombinase